MSKLSRTIRIKFYYENFGKKKIKSKKYVNPYLLFQKFSHISFVSANGIGSPFLYSSTQRGSSDHSRAPI